MAKKSRRKIAPAKKRAKGDFLFSLLLPLLPAAKEPDEQPWRWLPWLLLLAFALRAAVALAGDFVIHPDEIMQYLEPAHGLVFDRSAVYWEYYYGARSWIVPAMAAAVMYLCKLIGLDSPAYYIAAVKLFFCALSLSLPWALYILGRRLFGERSGRIALVLSVFWYELVGFAHKPMTEFVATAFILLLAVYVIRPQPLSARQAAAASVMAVFAVAVRFQYAPAAALILLAPFARADARVRLLMIAAAAAAVIAVGLFDYVTWGGFLHPYWLNFKVNVVLNLYRGSDGSVWDFMLWMSITSGGLFALALAAGAAQWRRRLFALLLAASILLPHSLQAHHEYRFVFLTIPLWILLLADFLALGWPQRKKHVNALMARWRPALGAAYAFAVSAYGISDALIHKHWVSRDNAPLIGFPNFVDNQKEVFPLYRQLAADESVRGVADVVRPYFDSGGYYYLHREIPFYSRYTAFYPPAESAAHVSHIIARQMVTPKGLVQQDDRLLIETENSGYFSVPGYISDATLGKLVYWDSSGRASVIEGFAPAHKGEGLTLWKAADDAPVHKWRRYHVAPDNQAMYGTVQRAVGDDSRKPAENFGIELLPRE